MRRAASGGNESRGAPLSPPRVRMKHPRALLLPVFARPHRCSVSAFGSPAEAVALLSRLLRFLRIAVGAAARQPLHAPASLFLLPLPSSRNALDCVCTARTGFVCREIPIINCCRHFSAALSPAAATHLPHPITPCASFTQQEERRRRQLDRHGERPFARHCQPRTRREVSRMGRCVSAPAQRTAVGDDWQGTEALRPESFQLIPPPVSDSVHFRCSLRSLCPPPSPPPPLLLQVSAAASVCVWPLLRRARLAPQRATRCP